MIQPTQVVKGHLDALSNVSLVAPELSRYAPIDILSGETGDLLQRKVRAVVHYSESVSGQAELGFCSANNPHSR